MTVKIEYQVEDDFQLFKKGGKTKMGKRKRSSKKPLMNQNVKQIVKIHIGGTRKTHQSTGGSKQIQAQASASAGSASPQARVACRAA